MRFLLFYARSIRDFLKDGGVMLAGSLSFFSLMAMVPLCLFLLSILAYVMGIDPDFLKFFTDRFAGMFPKITGDVTGGIKKLITYKGMGGMSLALYAVLSFQFYWALHNAINTVFKSHKKRMVVVTIFISFLVVSLMVGFLFLSFTLASSVGFLDEMGREIPWLQFSALKKFMLRYIIPPLISTGILMTIYKLMPMKSIRLINAFKGALATAFMLELAKHLFTFYVSDVVNLGTIYGSLTSFVIFMLWIYYSSAIFLIGGELVNNLNGIAPGNVATRKAKIRE